MKNKIVPYIEQHIHSFRISFPESGPPDMAPRPIQNGRHFPDDIFKCIFLNENVWVSIKISQMIVPKG